MNDIETALKAACVKLAEKHSCPSDDHCCHAMHEACDRPCWECWHEDLLKHGGAYIRAHIKFNPEEFVPQVRANFMYEPPDVYAVMSAAEEMWQAEYKLRLRAAIAKRLREYGLRYANERIIKKCHKAVLKSMPDIDETVQAKYTEYADECNWEDDLDTEETAVGTKEDPFGD